MADFRAEEQPERIVAVRDSQRRLVEYHALGAEDKPRGLDVEYVRADVHRAAVEIIEQIATMDKRGSDVESNTEAEMRRVARNWLANHEED